MINPPAHFLTDDKVFFSLGLLSIAGVAIAAGHRVDLYDLAGFSSYEKKAQELAQKRYDLYGVTATSPQFSYAIRILESIKSVHPRSRVVIGGPHATMFAQLRSERLRKHGFNEEEVRASDANFHSLERFDQVVKGEEGGIFEALKCLAKESPLKWIDGGLTESLDSLPVLPRHLIDMGSYLYKDDGTPKFAINGGPATSLISQRGCPFGCNFCSGRNIPQYRYIRNPETGTIRAFSPQRIITELNTINQEFPDVTGFMFYDDELNLETRTTLALMEALERNNRERERKGLKPYDFRGFVKSELLVRHPEVVPAMKKAGFHVMLSGFESGSDRILKEQVKKHTTVEINYQATKLAFENGIEMKALTMVGQPTETLEDVRMTEAFLESIGKLAETYGARWDFDLTILTPYPGSEVYDEAEPNEGKHSNEFQRVLREGELYLREVDFGEEVTPYKTAPGEGVVHVRTEKLSSGDLLALRQEVDDRLRARYNLRRHDRQHDPSKDIEHSMGQSTT